MEIISKAHQVKTRKYSLKCVTQKWRGSLWR